MNIARTTTDSQPSASTQALTKAIIRACSWPDASPENRMEAVNILRRPNYPWASDCIWYLAQMMWPWQVREQKSDAWYAETSKSVYRADIHEKTTNQLIKTGFFSDKSFPPGSDGRREHMLSFLEGRAHVRGVVTQHRRGTETLLRCRRASLSLQTAT